MKINQREKKGSPYVIILLIAAIFLALGYLPAMAGGLEPFGRKHGKGLGGPGHHRPALGIWQNQQIVETLELTDEQVTQLKEADFAAQEKRLELKAHLDRSRLEMQKAFSDDSVDDSAVLQIAEKIADLQGELFVQNVASRLTLGKILSTDQIDKLKQHVMEQKGPGPRRGRKHSFGQDSREIPGNPSLPTD